MSAPQFSVKRRFINAQNDWRYQQPKAPVTTSADQYIYGVKQFADPIKALNDVMCSGFYYGDGTHLTNVTGTDPTKLPTAGGTMTGPIIMSLDPVPVVVNTLTNELVEIVAAVDQIAAIGFTPATTSDPKVYLQNGVNTLNMSATNIEITGPGTGQQSLTSAGSLLYDYAGSRTVNNSYNGTEYFDPSIHSSTYARVGSSLATNWSGVDIRTGSSSEYSASLGFLSSFGQIPQVQLTAPNDSVEFTTNTLVAHNPAQVSAFSFSAPDYFFKWDAGTSFKIDIDDHHVNRDMAFKVINGPFGTADFQNYEHYLDPSGNAGWSIIISEGSGQDATITNPDSIWYYGHGIPGYTQQSNFQLKKWSTARITLVPSTVFAPNFAWAVSMY